MSQEGRGCLVAEQGGLDKVAQSGVRTRSSPIGSAHDCSQRVWKENGILSFINLLFFFFFFFFFLLFKNMYIVQIMYRKQQYNLRLMFAITLGPFVT